MSSHIRSYIDSVLKHVRSKDAHYGIQAELEAHINGLARTYRLRGYTEQEAVEKAVFEMGNPERAGKA
ncbi:permease prefix domain 1-containing protein [Alkalicoccus luteus]|uniref:Uncharacterized protein n=1 Tax=Alkalicoccus luteus TaxID=1237094 RepID=A0A969PNM8_9BACI|nr:permease prefix domain 1-containing protein [Alkalicoccus luteus]NJP37542.1 hypothetical protein [Alkalicoccus luteus]